jgi:hypothetical protein
MLPAVSSSYVLSYFITSLYLIFLFSVVSTDFILERHENTHSTQSINSGSNYQDKNEDEVFDITPKRGQMYLLLLSSFPPPYVDFFKPLHLFSL